MKKSIRLKLRSNIREARQKVDLTQEELAERASIDYKYLQRIEGQNPPDIKIEPLDKLAKALKTSPANLLDFK